MASGRLAPLQIDAQLRGRTMTQLDSEFIVKSQIPLSKHPDPASQWWAAFVAAIMLLVVSLAAGAVRHYVLEWF